MSQERYGLRKNDESGEYHIYRQVKKLDNKCYYIEKISICKTIDFSESTEIHTACLNEEQARIQYAEMGRKICANCIQDLYKNT